MAMVQHGTINQTLIPMAADAAGWCEAKILRTEQAVSRAPLASACLALLGGVLLCLCVLPRTRPRRRFRLA